MSQEKLKEYQKKLFEYDYTLKKIDTILMSVKLSPEDRELYQLNRESCHSIKSDCSKEMAEYAKTNRLSLLLAPLSKEEKDYIINSLEEKKKEGEPPVSINFMNLRDKKEYEEEAKESEERKSERGEYSTQKLAVAEDFDDYNEDLEKEDLENGDLDNEDLEEEEMENGDSSYGPEVIDFIKELKTSVTSFYGI